MRPSAALAAPLAFLLLAACAGTGPAPVPVSPDGLSYEDAARENASAILEGMMRAREDRLRREVRRMIAPELRRPPG